MTGRLSQPDFATDQRRESRRHPSRSLTRSIPLLDSNWTDRISTRRSEVGSGGDTESRKPPQIQIRTAQAQGTLIPAVGDPGCAPDRGAGRSDCPHLSHRPLRRGTPPAGNLSGREPGRHLPAPGYTATSDWNTSCCRCRAARPSAPARPCLPRSNVRGRKRRGVRVDGRPSPTGPSGVTRSWRTK